MVAIQIKILHYIRLFARKLLWKLPLNKSKQLCAHFSSVIIYNHYVVQLSVTCANFL